MGLNKPKRLPAATIAGTSVRATATATKIPNAQGTILAYNKTARNGMVNVLYADGHVEFQPEAYVKQQLERIKNVEGIGQ